MDEETLAEAGAEAALDHPELDCFEWLEAAQRGGVEQ